MKTKIVLSLTLTLLAVLSFPLAENAVAQKILVQTGFEEFTEGEPPKNWEVKGDNIKVMTDTVKTDKNSLAILAGANGNAVGVPVETKDPITSAEFWVYIKSGGRSWNFKLTSADNTQENAGGTYINWNADAIRLCCPWTDMGKFETDKWKYVRVVANFQTSQFDFYSGDSRENALNSEPQKKLKFRDNTFGPAAKMVVFHVWSTKAPGFVDDLLVYEGEEPPVMAVEPGGKLTTGWGQIKRQ